MENREIAEILINLARDMDYDFEEHENNLRNVEASLETLQDTMPDIFWILETIAEQNSNLF